MTEIHKLADLALKVISVKVKHYAGLMNVQYGRITIRNQKTRWGSCSSKGNLNFNCLLMLAPDEVVDYVVIHELCHLIEMNHSKAFWKQVEQVMPDYKKHRKWLRDHGSEVIVRMMQRGSVWKGGKNVVHVPRNSSYRIMYIFADWGVRHDIAENLGITMFQTIKAYGWKWDEGKGVGDFVVVRDYLEVENE